MKQTILLVGAAFAALAVPASAQSRMPDRPVPGPETRAQAEAKVRQHFGLLDLNKDGFVTRDEIRSSVDKMMADHQTLAFDALDANHDGSISRAEWAARNTHDRERVAIRVEQHKGKDVQDDYHDGAAMHEGGHMMMEGHGGPGGSDMFMMGVADKDGRLSINEVVKAALARFDKADANHDGVLTPEERRAAHAAMRAEMHVPG